MEEPVMGLALGVEVPYASNSAVSDFVNHGSLNYNYC